MKSEFVITTNIAGFKYYLRMDDRSSMIYQGLRNNATFFIEYEAAEKAIQKLGSAFDYNVEPNPFVYSIRQPIGRRLKEERERLGLTPKYVAEIIGCCLVTYQGYEHERAEPSHTLLIALSQLFEITIHELVKGRRLLLANKC